MACQKCDTCVLINNQCLSLYSTLKNIPISTIMSTVITANLDLYNCIGDCFDSLCSDEESEMKTKVLESSIFKAYYASAIQHDWECDYGSGQAKKQGITYAQSDDLQDFRVATQKEIAFKLGKSKAKLNERRKRFLEWFKACFPNCFEVEKKECGCGCNVKCGCDRQTNYDNIDNCVAL